MAAIMLAMVPAHRKEAYRQRYTEGDITANIIKLRVARTEIVTIMPHLFLLVKIMIKANEAAVNVFLRVFRQWCFFMNIYPGGGFNYSGYVQSPAAPAFA